MRRPTLATFLSLGLASAAPSIMPRQDDPSGASPPRKMVISAPRQIFTADFDGSSFKITSQNNTDGATPSWLLPKKPNLLYAVDEMTTNINIYTLGDDANKIAPLSTSQGSKGAVFLEFNHDQSRLVAAAYGTGTVDVWDSSNKDGSLKYFKQVNASVVGPATGAKQHMPHQAAVDPSGRYFAVPDLGGDKLLLLDGKEDRWDLHAAVNFSAETGPRHGSFLTSGDATYYAMVTELSNELFLFQVSYPKDGIATFRELQRQSTYGTGDGPANVTAAAAGELTVARNQRDVYVSNRLTGHATDSIAHFALAVPGGDDKSKASLAFGESVSSAGSLPRMLSLSEDDDQGFLFVANQDGDAGVAAFKRDPKTGKLDPKPAATAPGKDFIAKDLEGEKSVGPQFVREIQV